MVQIIKDKTRNTPSIIYDEKNKCVYFEGDCTPEDSVFFFESFIPKLLNLINENKASSLNFNLNYYNSSSAKCFLDMFITISKIHNIKNSLKVEWQFDNEDIEMKEPGETFEIITKLDFKFIEN